MIKKIEDFLEGILTKNDEIFLSAILIVFSLLRIPSVSEPYWYGDEGVYEVVGMAIRAGRTLYSQIWDNKPPLLYLIYALFNGDLFYVRLLSLIFGILSVIAFFIVSKKLFKNNLASYLSTSLFVLLFATPYIEGNIANAENFMILPILISFYLLFCTRSKKILYTVISGIFLSLAFLTKIVALFDFAAFGILLFYLRFFETIKFNAQKISKEIKEAISEIGQEVLFAIAFLTPIVLTVIYFVVKGAFSSFFQAVFSQNVGYVGYANFFIIPNGLIYLKLFLLIFATLLAFRFRQNLGRSGLLIFVWLFFALFDAFFSARPYTHYLLTLVPAFCLFVGYVLENKKILFITVPFLLIILFLVDHNFSPYKKNVAYYENYLKFITGGSTVVYRNFFDPNTQRDYDLANFVKSNTNPTDNIFVWADGPQVYPLADKLPPGRYTVAYHITYYKNAIDETKTAVKNASPKYIIQIKSDPEIQNFLDGYEFRYKIDDANIYERQY